MGLRVKGLRLADFRSFEGLDVELSGSTTVFVGPNAAGKTNAVEALQLLTAGASFRHSSPTELVREGASSARASARLEGDGRVIDLRLDAAPGRRAFFRNNKRVQAAELPQTLMSVIFTPDDLGLVKQGASFRRDELDAFGRQAARGYQNVLTGYQRSLEQRNRLLKDDEPDLALLDVWDESVARAGAALLHARLRLVGRLAPRVREAYRKISGGEELGCSYASGLGEGLGERPKEELLELLRAGLVSARADDLRRRQTTVGPHRDDLVLAIDGRAARAFGSQGQQRSVVLALKMAEVGLAAEVTGQTPLLLLDDVMSELDAARRQAMMDLAEGGVQTVITTTNLGYFSPEVLDAAEVVDFGKL